MRFPRRQSQQIRLNRGLIAETGLIPPGYKFFQDSIPFKMCGKPQTVIVEDMYGKKIPVMKVAGLFQRAEVENSNGRVYERPILAEAVRLIQDDVGRRAVYGELDHPCVQAYIDEQINIMTLDGWKDFNEIKIGDKVWSCVSGRMTPSTVNHIINEPFDGEAYHFKGRHIDIKLTSDHRVFMRKRIDGPYGEEYATVSEINENRRRFNKNIIPRTANYAGMTPEHYVVPAILMEDLKLSVDRYAIDPTTPLRIDTKTFVQLLGIYLAEGHTNNKNVIIDQFNEEHKPAIREMLDRTGISYNEIQRGFCLQADWRLATYLGKLGDKYNKYIPADVKQLDAPYLEELVRWFQKGDGRAKHGHNHVFSVSKRLIDDLHECWVKAGGCCYRTTIITEEDYTFADHTIKAANKSPLHQLTLSTTAGIYMDNRFLKITKEHHTGRIYCLSVDHGNFYMEHNGCSFWTGNCDAKIHMDRISHLNTKLWMDGNDVYGEAEILDNQFHGAALRGLFERKCQVGISSRGVGDMEQRDISENRQAYYVMPGYTIITCDAVAEPSVASATLTVMESLARKTKNLQEAKIKSIRRNNLLEQEEYENLLVDAVHDFFDIKPIIPVKKNTHKIHSFDRPLKF